MTAPIERMLRLATTVNDLPAAWVFVMANIDAVGPAPSVEIKPAWTGDYRDTDTWTKHYSVVVSGTVGGPLT